MPGSSPGQIKLWAQAVGHTEPRPGRATVRGQRPRRNGNSNAVAQEGWGLLLSCFPSVAVAVAGLGLLAPGGRLESSALRGPKRHCPAPQNIPRFKGTARKLMLEAASWAYGLLA